jgi:hypothetical protein
MTVQSPPPPPGYTPPPGGYTPPPAGYPPPPPPAKKGMGALGWVLIGCGAIIVIALVVIAAATYMFKTRVVDPLKKNPGMAVARMIVQANPDLDLVSEDDNASTLTIHNKKTNETITVSLDDVKNGRMRFSSEGKGSVTIDGSNPQGVVQIQDDKGQKATFSAGAGASNDLPAWLPVYPGAKTSGGFSSKSATESVQTVGFTTSDSADRVLSFYTDKLKDNGLTVQPSATVAVGGQTNTGFLTAESSDKKRHVQITVGTSNGQTSGSITYQEKQ